MMGTNHSNTLMCLKSGFRCPFQMNRGVVSLVKSLYSFLSDRRPLHCVTSRGFALRSLCRLRWLCMFELRS